MSQSGTSPDTTRRTHTRLRSSPIPRPGSSVDATSSPRDGVLSGKATRPIHASEFRKLITPRVFFRDVPSPHDPEGIFVLGQSFPVGEQKAPEQLLLCNVPPQYRKGADARAFLRMEEAFLRFMLGATEVGYGIPNFYMLRSALHPRVREFFRMQNGIACEPDAQVISREVIRLVELKQRGVGAPFMIGEEQLMRYCAVSLDAANTAMRKDIDAKRVPGFITEYALLSYRPTTLDNNERSGTPDLLILLPVAAVAALMLYDPICQTSRVSWDFTRGSTPRCNRDLKSNVLRSFALQPHLYEGSGAREGVGDDGIAVRFLRGLSREVTCADHDGTPVTMVRFFMGGKDPHAFADMRHLLARGKEASSYRPPLTEPSEPVSDRSFCELNFSRRDDGVYVDAAGLPHDAAEPTGEFQQTTPGENEPF